ncbi:hypothetical protein CBR_g22139 [Chara braunii]|uniref:DDE Tnp4 domain-containing protein n=1 Tax=Chara braunii TaxID=69332 RepID=A0A388L2D3_CHABU|nr:hypothetical protein CBR_g22139 [Chara braunii]|eukprot:GBG76392.1 hypothetical protein CBR_g22139 [Chara braunii]
MRRSPSLLAAFLLLLLPCFFTLQYAGRGGGGGGDRGEVLVRGGARGGEAGGRAASTSENENVATALLSARRAEDDDHLHRLRRLFRIPEASEGRLLQRFYGTSNISTIDAALVADGTSVVKFPGDSPEAEPGTATALERGGRLLSYWWPAANPSGRANMTAFVEEDPSGSGESGRFNPMMSFISSMDVTKSDTHLAVFPKVIGIGKRLIVFIDVASEDRTAIEVSDVDSPGSLAFNRLANERLYIADTAAPYRILSAPMLPGDDGIPVSSTTVFAPGPNFPKGGTPNITETTFAAQSLDSQGRCLYFSDSTNLTVWSLDLTSPSSRTSSPSESSMSRNVTHVAGSGEKRTQDGPGLSASFDSLSHPVVTRDGCNVFVADGITLRWIKLSSPCSTAREVTSVAKTVPLTFRSLALFDDGTSNPLLCLGTMDGQVYKLEINRAALHPCGDGTHVFVDKPKTKDGDEFMASHKKRFSIVAQLVFDLDLRILDMCYGFPGTIADGCVLRNSSLFRMAVRGGLFQAESSDPTRHLRPTVPGVPNGYLLADAGYPTLSWIVVPYGMHNPPVEIKVFDDTHKLVRSCAERENGVLKMRFQYFYRPHVCDIRIEGKEFHAACILHNLLLSLGDLPEGANIEGVGGGHGDQPANGAPRCSAPLRHLRCRGAGLASRVKSHAWCERVLLKLVNKKNECEHVRSRLQHAHRENGELHTSLRQSRREIEDVHKCLHEAEGGIDEQRRRLHEAKGEIDELHRHLVQAEGDNDKMQTRVADAEIAMQEAVDERDIAWQWYSELRRGTPDSELELTLVCGQLESVKLEDTEQRVTESQTSSSTPICESCCNLQAQVEQLQGTCKRLECVNELLSEGPDFWKEVVDSPPSFGM